MIMYCGLFFGGWGGYVRRILCHYFHGEPEDGEEMGFTITYFRNCDISSRETALHGSCPAHFLVQDAAVT